MITSLHKHVSMIAFSVKYYPLFPFHVSFYVSCVTYNMNNYTPENEAGANKYSLSLAAN